MSKRTFYKFFDCRADALSALLESMAQAFRREIAQHATGIADPLELAAQIGLAHLRVSRSYPTIVEQALGANQGPRTLRLAYLQLVVDSFRATAQSPDDPTRASRLPSGPILLFLMRGLERLPPAADSDPRERERETAAQLRSLLQRLARS